MPLLLSAEAVAFAYPQHGRGVNPVSFSLAAGEAVHISSPSGGGKSTLARCLTGLIPHLYQGKLSGTVWVNGQRSDQALLWQLSQAAGLVFQNPSAQMLAPTVEEEIIFGLENLGLPAAEIDRRVEAALERFGLQPMQGRSPLSLSGGEQQKLALAAITARQPAILVLDEPLSMLDTTAAFDLVDHLSGLSAQGTALVICEHRQEYLRGLPGLRTLVLNGSPAAGAGVPSEGLENWPGAHRSALPGAKRSALPGAKRSALRLEASDLQVRRGGKTILNGWDFSLQGGQLTAVVGRNGVGKTTLFRTLAGLQSSQAGELVVRNTGRPERPQLGMVFQNPDLQLFNATVREEILYRLPQPDLRLYAWLAAALDLERYEDTPPLLLSEGEKRRVALATVLMRQPAHGILLDEPALGQDAAHKAMLVWVLRSLANSGQIVAYSTHDVELALQADQLVILGPQGILASGPPHVFARQEEAWRQAGLRLPEWVSAPC